MCSYIAQKYGKVNRINMYAYLNQYLYKDEYQKCFNILKYVVDKVSLHQRTLEAVWLTRIQDAIMQKYKKQTY